MARRIPEETLEAIRDRVSLVEVVSAYVALRRAGRNHVGLCPFHAEKTPSFTVSEDRGLFHCFGCGAGGTVFTFLMRIEGLEFQEAVEQLARRAGVRLPPPETRAAETGRHEGYALNERAAAFFQRALDAPPGERARRYLTARGVRPETARRFGLGYAPAHGAGLAAELRGGAGGDRRAVELGLLGRRADGRLYDRFRDRVMFPIRDRRGRVIGFGGRTLGDEVPKYLNSPESAIFRKREALYGLAEAREAVRHAERAVVVEGYLDAILLVQEGFPYTVATLGTALTAQQLRALRAMGGAGLVVYFCFDGDEAGRRAADRAVAVSVEAGLWGHGVFLPGGYDPDRFVREHGAAAFAELLDGAGALTDFYFERLAPPGASPAVRARAAREVQQLVARIPDAVDRELFVREAALRLGVGEEVLRSASAAGSVPAARFDEGAPPEEGLLLEAMVSRAACAALVAERGTLAAFRDATLARVGRAVVDAWERGRPVSEVVEGVPEPLGARLRAAALGAGPTAVGGCELEIARDCIERIERRIERERRRAMLGRLARGGDAPEDWRRTLEEIQRSKRSELRRREGGAA